MAEKPRGQVIYEILIVILAVALVGSILFPAKTWNKQEENEQICRARMSTLQQMEYWYSSKTSVYTDSFAVVKDTVLADNYAVTGLDSSVTWDELLTQDEIKALILETDYPQALTDYIKERLDTGRPIYNLRNWDNLITQLVSELQTVVNALEEETEAFDQAIDWATLVGENRMFAMLDNEEIPRSVRRRTSQEVRRNNRAVNETRYWSRYRPYFMESLNDFIATALRTDIWLDEQEDDWEKAAMVEWNAEKDALSQAEKDSLWQENKHRFWEDERELVWKVDRKRLWREEGEIWPQENEVVWKRITVQKWASERKKSWEQEQQSTLPDSLLELFPAQKDSLWRANVETLEAEEYPAWEMENAEFVEETIKNLWERARRVQWEDGAYTKWLESYEVDSDKLWETVKQKMWTKERPELWIAEQNKVRRKMAAQARLDQSVSWINVLDANQVHSIVDGLSLPDAAGVYKKYKLTKRDSKAGESVLYELGLVGLYRDALLAEVDLCPTCHEKIIMVIDNEKVVKDLGLYCPIHVADGDANALQIKEVMVPDTADAEVMISKLDTTFVPINLTATEKLLGGASIKNHGNIDTDGKKSWEKKSR